MTFLSRLNCKNYSNFRVCISPVFHQNTHAKHSYSEGWLIVWSSNTNMFAIIWRIYITQMVHIAPGGGTPYVMGDTYVPRFWPPFFTLAGSSTIFWGYFSHPPTAKLSFGVQKLPIFTKIDLFGPKLNFFLDLFGSNFQRPAAHPHQFSGRVPPPGYCDTIAWLKHVSFVICKL